MGSGLKTSTKVAIVAWFALIFLVCLDAVNHS